LRICLNKLTMFHSVTKLLWNKLHNLFLHLLQWHQTRLSLACPSRYHRLEVATYLSFWPIFPLTVHIFVPTRGAHFTHFIKIINLQHVLNLYQNHSIFRHEDRRRNGRQARQACLRNHLDGIEEPDKFVTA
jgi:hypothetical protein